MSAAYSLNPAAFGTTKDITLAAVFPKIRAFQFLVSSSTTFPVENEALLQEVPADHSVELVWLDGRDLLDPHFFANPLTFPGASGGVGKPEGWDTEGWDKEYLESLRIGLG